MAYRTPILTEIATEVGVSCCTPQNNYAYCQYPPPPPPSCKVLVVTISGYSCGDGVPPPNACVALPHVHTPVGPHLPSGLCV